MNPFHHPCSAIALADTPPAVSEQITPRIASTNSSPPL